MTIVDKSGERLSMDAALHSLLTIEDSCFGNIGLREKLLLLEKKLASNQLHLAVLGQMKRGKSSFINAILGAEILPTGVLPVTETRWRLSSSRGFKRNWIPVRPCITLFFLLSGI